MFKVGGKVRRKESKYFGVWPYGDIVLIVKSFDHAYIYLYGLEIACDPVRDMQIEIKAGKRYKMRNGQLSEKLKLHERSGMFHNGEMDALNCITWYPTGVYFINDEHPFNLISEVKCCPTCGGENTQC